MDANEKARSYFCVLNNPAQYFEGTPEEIAETALDKWCVFAPDRRTGVAVYAISAEGLHHLHLVLCDSGTAKFTALKATYPAAHIEASRGTKAQIEDYITKQGVFKEKGETILCTVRRGEIEGSRQGQRADLEAIPEYIKQGLNPAEIMDLHFPYYRLRNEIREAYYRKRFKETPTKRDVRVFWHLGVSGSGKSFEYVKLCDREGEGNIYFVNDAKNGFDKYCGERILFIDEFRGPSHAV